VVKTNQPIIRPAPSGQSSNPRPPSGQAACLRS
jgi:hypothetical protein